MDTTKKRTFESLIFGDWITFDPHLAFDEASRHIVENVYDGPSDDAASSCCSIRRQSDGNGERYFLTPSDVRFHEGSSVTHKDISYSLARSFLLADHRSPLSELTQIIWSDTRAEDPKFKIQHPEPLITSIEHATELNRDVLVLAMPMAFAPALGLLKNWLLIVCAEWCVQQGEWDGTWNNVEMLSSTVGEVGLGWKTNGTGVYRVAEHRTGLTVLRAHPSPISGDAGPFFSEVRVRRTDSPEERVAALESGDVDFAVCSRQGLRSLSSESPVELELYDGLPELNVNPFAGFTFDIDTTDNPLVGSARLDGDGIPSRFFANLDVRRMCVAAFDLDAFHAEGLSGVGTPSLGPIPGRMLPTKDEHVDRPGYDPDAARELYRHAFEGALSETGCRFTIATHEGNPERILAAEILAAGLRAIDPSMRVDAQAFEWTDYLDLIQRHRAPLFWIGWQADYPDPHSFAKGLVHSRGFFGRCQRLAFQDLDALTDRAVREPDPDTRMNLYRQINEKALKQAPQIYTFERERFVVLNASIRGFTFNPLRASVFTYADLARL